MAFFNGRGGYVSTFINVDGSPSGVGGVLPITEWEYESSVRLQEITAADSGQVAEVTSEVADVDGRVNVIWDSVLIPEAVGVSPGTAVTITLQMGASGRYYQFAALIGRYRPRVDTRTGVIQYEFSFKASGIQPYHITTGPSGEPLTKRPQTSSGIEYRVLHEGGGGYLESLSAGNYASSYVVLVDWDSANDLVQDFLGTHTKTGAPAIQRRNPEQHLYFPQLRCVRMELLRNYGPPSMDLSAQGMIQYDQVAYRAYFESVPYAVLEDQDAYDSPYKELSRYVSVRMVPGMDVFTLPGYGFKWVGGSLDGKTVMTPPAMLFPNMTITLTWHYVPGIPYTAIAACLGCVNQDQFNVPLRDGTVMSFEPETVLLQGWEPEFMPATIGQNTLWRIVYHLNVRGAGGSSGPTWNQVFNAGDGVFYPVVQVSTGKPPYSKQDMDSIFVLP